MKTNVKRTTIYVDARLHKALRLKAAETDRSISYLVNEAVRLSLAEELEDLAAFEERAEEPNLPFEDVLKELRRSGQI
ncbi:MAG: ribbon-helix-helix protein, CopG family [Candidatus Marinimicrobia bacterium]|nr:ribbon-helix-helix protein, CopG family [Candidatus Neomarinimicrobiota bacterium]